MKRYVVTVKTPNRILMLKGKPARSPLTYLARKDELQGLETKFRADQIEYTIEDYVPPAPKSTKIDVVVEEIETPSIDKDSTLGQFMDDDNDDF